LVTQYRYTVNMTVTIKVFFGAFYLLAFLKETGYVLSEVRTEVLCMVEENLSYPITCLDRPLGAPGCGCSQNL
jgi:hypothetical protein